MAKARAIIKRRKAVQNIRKITRTMQLIATARFQAAYNRATATKPYTERITELVEQLSRGAGDIEHPLLRVNTESRRSVLIVITSNRGLCGGYNAAILRSALDHLRDREHAGETVDLHVLGRKGTGFFRFLNRPMAVARSGFEDKPLFDDVNDIAQQMMEAYERRQINSVHVTFMRFISTAVQRVTTLQLLPIERPAAGDGAARAGEVQYEFTPPAPELLAELLPETVRVRLFQCFTDAAVSEQVARMVAMKAATDAAGDMVRSLTQQYNRARQSQITLELLDIVSGAEAIK
ncbi:MAG TPA: ATP synthase F1 subunit gamma [Phycisphaerae bacterium]|jgi:F-type H+-transporting ATPase subunit gamma|nr:ATP synthase F1 subunit gamma [Phycisphaerae bacterium]HOB75236.1 ATP synthase F1 subunit gamma [Phycisphaerae bacterium]HOJ54717.1 ATP synthase F1 subunit gamma [Phycisphaerae bacterium]HOL25932.1 ATP synthase F1 subunit gamma [Phycisphaerae bacterium]HPP19495.1 ATP synthase F1 subunit gamma [Phycisphaerae bacterium]